MNVFVNYRTEEAVLPSFTASVLLLIWLALDQSKSIKGKTAFVKQPFVAAKRLFLRWSKHSRSILTASVLIPRTSRLLCRPHTLSAGIPLYFLQKGHRL